MYSVFTVPCFLSKIVNPNKIMNNKIQPQHLSRSFNLP